MSTTHKTDDDRLADEWVERKANEIIKRNRTRKRNILLKRLSANPNYCEPPIDSSSRRYIAANESVSHYTRSGQVFRGHCGR